MFSAANNTAAVVAGPKTTAGLMEVLFNAADNAATNPGRCRNYGARVATRI